MATRPVAVVIGGQRYVVKSDADETYVRTLAAYVDQKLEEVRAKSRGLPPEKLLILAALNVTDELLAERQKRVELKRQIREKTKAVLGHLDRINKRQRKDRR